LIAHMAAMARVIDPRIIIQEGRDFALQRHKLMINAMTCLVKLFV